MVSGLVTSPCDQLRIFSGEARLMRIASKSAITFAISNGLERNKVFLRFLRSCATASGSQNQFLVPDSQCSVEPVELLPFMRHRELMPQRRMFQKSISILQQQHRCIRRSQLRLSNPWRYQSAAALAVGFFSVA